MAVTPGPSKPEKKILFQELCRLYGAHKTRTTTYHPSGNHTAERINRTFKSQLAKKLLEGYDDEWDSHLRGVEFAYNTKIHSTTKYTPHFLFFGREATLPIHISLGKCTPNARAPDYVSDLTKKVARAHAEALQASGISTSTTQDIFQG